MDRTALFALGCSALLVSAAYLAGFGTVATLTDSATANGNVSSADDFGADVTVVDAVANSQPGGGGDGTGQQCGSGQGSAGNAPSSSAGNAPSSSAGNAPSGSAGNAPAGNGLAGCGGSGGNDGGRYVAPAARPLTLGGRR
ncbi:hypothetical protein [Haloarchaeobius salinus]|uniref:hypothetical protein n=1 Tax=Haloarchaeobius salinus TaxID=1198298 RepID=UPI00210E20AD|nr:hypothetical protein [Haloarchaeobius salinus]